MTGNFKCALCGVLGVEGDPDDMESDADVLCPPCRLEVEAGSMVISDPVELILGRHMAITFGDYKTMCGATCLMEFEGPALHRRHVAALIRGALGLEPPAPWTPVIEQGGRP